MSRIIQYTDYYNGRSKPAEPGDWSVTIPIVTPMSPELCSRAQAWAHKHKCSLGELITCALSKYLTTVDDGPNVTDDKTDAAGDEWDALLARVEQGLTTVADAEAVRGLLDELAEAKEALRYAATF